jgi:hypothetical protein
MAAVRWAVQETQNAYPHSSIGWQVMVGSLEIHAVYFRDLRAHFRASYNPRRKRVEVFIEPGNYSRPTLLAAYNAAVKVLQSLGEKGWAELEAAVAAERQPGVRQD